MQNFVTAKGIILKSLPAGEYDRRIVMLTTDMGKISAFAKGARKTGSPLLASTDVFCFGDYKMFAGKNSYSVCESNVINYFPEMRSDYEKSFLGMYFLEVVDYYGRENNDDKDMLKLLYQSLTALCKSDLSKEFIRGIFELKVIMINGEFPGLNVEENIPGLKSAIDYLYNTPADKVFSFKLSKEAENEFVKYAARTAAQTFDVRFNSLDLI